MNHLKFIFSFCLLIASLNLAYSQCNSQMDYTALRALYLSTDGDNWQDNSGWPDAATFVANPTIPAGTDISTWFGMVCDNGRILYVYLPDNNLNGTIPSEIGMLSTVVELNLNDNQAISGTLPIELWSLSNLNRLYLWNTDVSGNIPPAISGLVSLEEIIITYNQMSGPLPVEITQLPNLAHIELRGIGLTGTLPATLYNMTQLIVLDLVDNNINIGQLPSTISNLVNLEHLGLGGGNIMTGTIPSELWDLTNLRHVDFSTGTLTGQIPAAIGNLVFLEVLLLGDNMMSGPLPDEMKDLSNMFFITLDNNSFSGSIDDDFFDKWENIHDIRFQDNQFTGNLPSSLGNRVSLRVALFNNNQFTGCFPYNYINLCTNRDYVPSSAFDFTGNSGLATNNGDFDAFCNAGAGACPTTIDCQWVEIIINSGTGPIDFNYTIAPFDFDCNNGEFLRGKYNLYTAAPNTSFTYVYELEESWYRINASNPQYNGTDLSQTIEVKDHSSGAVLIPQTPIENFVSTDFFPVCSATIVNQNLLVTNNNDSGPGSFRQAIIDSNCTFGKDDITIQTTGTINLTSCKLPAQTGCFIVLPHIRDEVCIHGNGITLTSNTTGRLFYNVDAKLTLNDLTIDNIDYSTFSGGTGGAIWNGVELELNNVTLSNNHAGGAGGGIYSYGIVDINNCTFSNNSSGNSGGAVFINTGTMNISHSTFSDNSSPEGGAICSKFNGLLNLEYSILANSIGDSDLNTVPPLNTNNTNLVESCVGDCPTFQITADPQLSPLQDNGGVSYTHALQAGGTPGSVVTMVIQLGDLAFGATETINYTPNGCGAVSVNINPTSSVYPCAFGDDGILGTPDDGMCTASCAYVDDGNGTVTISLQPSAGDSAGLFIPNNVECTVTVTVAACGSLSPAIDAAATSSVLLDQRGYDIFNGIKDIGAYEYGGEDPDGCDLVEFESSNIMGNAELIDAHLFVGANNTIDMNADIIYQASQLIDLKVGFEVKMGSQFLANIGPCLSN